MAERKRPETRPQGGSASVHDKRRGTAAMPGPQFASLIRHIKKAKADDLRQLRHATFTQLRRLKVARNPKAAISGTPEGSDQTDIGSLLVWIEGVGRRDTEAVAQLLAIDATLVARG